MQLFIDFEQNSNYSKIYHSIDEVEVEIPGHSSKLLAVNDFENLKFKHFPNAHSSKLGLH